ncbi:HK97 family phage prohead protease [Zavarzinia compransoris]|uniref:HK97 family phage prohead protease n=1 Tax=Zavarzinia compransoris TaxID=1264899 RepID=A0A317DXE8_9PROT|nr:HK97 family phage prohead protease [Zavarzinia compransoris]PWR19142.1 HK97 family phage prohead protease [Zavarzinia compransoris]TDP49156.1 prohead peptidase [Zavarzinia compransoris]
MILTQQSAPVAIALKRAGAEGVFAGYASVFGVTDAQGDRVAPGAFRRSLERWRGLGQMPPFLWQHDMAEPIGRFDLVAEDERGLRVEGRLALETVRGREAQALMRLGAVNGLSIGYSTVAARIDGDGARLLTGLDLHEISLVTLPANEAARIAWVKAARPDETGLNAAIIANLRRAADALAPGKDLA